MMSDQPGADGLDLARATFTLRWPSSQSGAAAAADLDPDEVTAALGITPSWVHRTGQAAVDEPGSDVVYAPGSRWDHSSWTLDSRRDVPSERLTDHLAWLMAQLAPAARQVRRFTDSSGVSGSVFCLIQVVEGRADGLSLAEQYTQVLGTMGVPLDVEIYCHQEDQVW